MTAVSTFCGHHLQGRKAFIVKLSSKKPAGLGCMNCCSFMKVVLVKYVAEIQSVKLRILF